MREYNVNIVLSTVGTALGVSIIDIQNVLGLILTITNIIILFVSLGLKIYKYIKNDGKLDKDEIEDLSKDVEDIKQNLKK